MDLRLQGKGYVKRPAGNNGWSWRVNGRTDGQTADQWRWPLPWHEKPLCLSDLGWSTDVTIASSRSRSQPAPHDSSLRSSEGPWHTYKRATLSSTTTITPTSTTISLLIMGPNTVNTSPSKARGGEHYYLYSNRMYMKTWETFFFSRNRFRKLFNTGLSSPSCRGRPRLTYLRLPVSRLQLYTTYILPFTKINQAAL